jgi:membrane protease YdiL (CAAX protease family)
MTQSDSMRKIQLVELSLAGAAVFYLTSFAIALLPFSAQFRAAESYTYADVLVGALPSGLLIALFVSYCMLAFFEKIPTKSSISKSVLLSVAALLAIELVATLLHGGDELYYFSIGTLLSVPRFLFLGIIIGYLYRRVEHVIPPGGTVQSFESRQRSSQ